VLARDLRLAKARAARRRRWLGSSAAIEQRVASRKAFHGMAAVASERLLGHDFGSWLAAVSANPARSIAAKGTVVRYLGDSRALVRTAHGLSVETSSVPLRVGQSGESERPVDLSLRQTALAFVAVNPLQAVSVSRRLSGGVAVGSAGIRVIPQGADVAGGVIDGQDVFFADVATDEDAVISPTIRGADLSTVLRSQMSPERIVYHADLPSGATLQAVDGGALIVRDGKALARVFEPVARDAQGTAVPVTMAVSGDEIVVTVALRGRSVAYPVLVDPEVVIITESSEHWRFMGDGTGSAPGGGSPLTAEVSGTYPEKEPCYAGEGSCGTSAGTAEWAWELGAPVQPATVGTNFKTEFDDITFSASTPAGHPEDARWYLSGFCGNYPGGGNGGTNSNEPPSATETTTTECEPEQERGVEVHVVSGQDQAFYIGEPVPQINAGVSISIGAILVSESLPLVEEPGSELYGSANEGEPARQDCFLGKAVNCVTGDRVVTQSDLEVGGRGPGLELVRTYNSQLAVAQSKSGQKAGPFGYGWTSSYSAHLQLGAGTAIVHQDDGSTVSFLEEKGGKYIPTSPLVQATLVKEGSSYVYTLPDQTRLTFNGHGLLTSETDRNGNAITLSYEEICEEESHTDVVARGATVRPLATGESECVSPPPERLIAITDSAGRKITLKYNEQGLVETATDTMGHKVKYEYSEDNLTGVTEPGESTPNWQFKYDSSHQMTSQTEAPGHTTTIEYNGAHRVTTEVDPMAHERTWEYTGSEASPETHIKEPNGAVTVMTANAADLLTSFTKAFGTSLAAKSTYEYNGSDYLVAAIDPNGHETKYGYGAEGNRTSAKDANGDETKWTYDSTHDVDTITTPDGETTTIKRDAHGNPEVIERPAPGSSTQKTTYKYDTHGDVESKTDPSEHTWKYEYDGYGDRKGEVDPEDNKRTWEFNEDSQEIATVSPRGNAEGAEASKFTTKTERDAQDRPLKITEGLGETAYNLQFGITGSESEKLIKPSSAVVDASGDVWVTDRGGDRVEEFSASGTFIKSFGGTGTGSGKFEEPRGIAINASTKNMYVVDEDTNRISEFNEKGEFVRAFGWGVSNGEAKLQTCTSTCRSGLTGPGVGELDKPKGVAIDSSGNVWIADEENNRIDEFNEKGEFIAAFGFGVLNGESKLQTCTTTCKIGLFGTANGEFGNAAYLAFSGGNLYVTDLEDNRVQEFNTSREYVAKFGTKGTGNGQFSEPAGIAADSSGNLYVADFANGRVEEFTTSGTYVAQFGTKGTGNGQLKEPEGVAFDSSGDMYVVDDGNNRVEEWAAHVTKDAYGANGKIESQADPNGNITKYTYNADNQLTKTEEPNKATIETEYDAMGQVTAQTDGNKHATDYKRNLLEETTEESDPLGHKTKKEYYAAGNLKKLEDPTKRTTTYTYDPANRPTEVSYSSGNPSTIKYEYNKDGDRTKMTDGTGTTGYTYDQLDRLTETENGHKEVVKYEYNLANEKTKITYPNGKSVTRAFDKDGRLEKVTDWNGKETKFSYDPDSDLKATVFPSETKDEDQYTYNNIGEISEVKMLKGTETLASLAYTRNSDSQVKAITSKGLPGEEKPTYEYDPNNRLTKGAAISYEYDSANNPTKIGAGTYKYNSGNELETGPSLTYIYDELGERTKAKPSTGPATTYGYDQAGDLTSVERPKEGETSEIKDSYAYNGDGLRVSQTIAGTTTYMAWDNAEELPLLLSDGTNSYIYGPEGLPIEQISSGGTTSYLHHDQQGSTRLLTGSAGTVTGKCTYTPYGVPTCEGATTTPLGYDGQYTNSDTGLIYLRARTYDPATGQFLTVDPDAAETQEPYGYAADNPVNESDPSGMCAAASAASYRGRASKTECEDLLGELVSKAQELHRRYNQLFYNRKGLPPSEVKKYVKTFNDKQSNLQKEFDRFGKLGCDKKSYGLQVPEEVYEALETKVNVQIRVVPVA
jgi:RHS repeat-associated protein